MQLTRVQIDELREVYKAAHVIQASAEYAVDELMITHAQRNGLDKLIARKAEEIARAIDRLLNQDPVQQPADNAPEDLPF